MTTTRQQEIINAYKQNPTKTFSEIAAPFGVTGVRVRQIVTKAMRSLDPNWVKPTPPTYYICKACGGRFEGASSTRYCTDHRGKGYVEGDMAKVLVRHCLVCGKRFEISAAKVAGGAAKNRRVGVYDSNACRLRAMRTRPIKSRALR